MRLALHAHAVYTLQAVLYVLSYYTSVTEPNAFNIAIHCRWNVLAALVVPLLTFLTCDHQAQCIVSFTEWQPACTKYFDFPFHDNSFSAHSTWSTHCWER